MIEPTGTESPETLDAFIGAMRELVRTCQGESGALENAPKIYVTRLDEVKAA